MKIKTVSNPELSKGNKRFCLSANRVLGTCFKCSCYPKCESKVNSKVTEEYEKLVKEASMVYKKIEKIRKEINNLRKY